MVDQVRQQTYFSLLRWRESTARDEAKNIAVLLFDESGTVGGIRHAPLSQISPRLSNQGIMDALIRGLQEQFSAPRKPTFGSVTEWRRSLQRSLYLTKPAPTAAPDVDLTLGALYKALVAPRARGGSRAMTKGRVLDQVVSRIRRSGAPIRRGAYVDDFLFDAVIDLDTRPSVVEVLSFATTARDWTTAEHDAGHFLYALEHVERQGVAIVEPPSDSSHERATISFDRVSRWFRKAEISVLSLSEVADQWAPLHQPHLGEPPPLALPR